MAEESSTQLRLEYASSGRAACKANKRCKFYSPEMDKKGAAIEKGKVRVSKTSEAGEGMTLSAFYHPECFFSVIVPGARSWTVEDPSALPGFDALQGADQTNIIKIFDDARAPATRDDDAGETKKKEKGKKRAADAETEAAAEDDREYVPKPEKKGRKSKKAKAAADEE